MNAEQTCGFLKAVDWLIDQTSDSSVIHPFSCAPVFNFKIRKDSANTHQDEAATLHRDGCRLMPFADPTYELKGTKTFIHDDRQLNFKHRIEAICDTFRVSSSFVVFNVKPSTTSVVLQY